MAQSQKKSSSSAVNSKEKNDMLDLDIGKDDFLSSWKPEGDTLDFDFGPVSKGNKKPFQFDKSSMDFNMDDDFGMPSFDMNMSDLDISPPLKKDGSSKEKSKETSGADKGKAERKLPSFDMDMPDLDISSPVRKDGKSNEKSKELSGGKKNGKADQFDFGFDFNDMDDFNFDPSPPKNPKGLKAQTEKNSLESVDVERSLTKKGSEAKQIKENLVENVDLSTLGKEDSKTQKEEHNIESLKIFDTNLSLAKECSKAPKDKCGIDCMENSNFEASLAKEGSMIHKDEDTVQVSEHLNFERSFREDGSEIQQDKDDVKSSPDGTQCQVMDDSPQVDLIGYTNSTEDILPNPSSPETIIAFDNVCQISGGTEIESRRNFPLKVAIDDSAISKCSAAAEEVSSDKAKILPQNIASAEFPKSRPVDKSICLEPVAELEVSTENDADVSSDSPTNNELNRGISEVPVESIRSIGEQDANVTSLPGSADINKLMKLDSSECLQRVEISQENSVEKSQRKLENHVKNNNARTEYSQVNSIAENSCITGGVPGILSDSSATTKNNGTTLEIPKLSSVSQLPDKLANKAMKEREPSVTLSRFFIQSGNPKGHVQEASSTQPTDSPSSSKMKGSTQCSLIEGKRNTNGIQRDESTCSLPLMHSRTHFTRKLPQKQNQNQNQESVTGLKTCGAVLDSARLQNTKKCDDSLDQNHEMVKGKTAQRQRESILRDLDTLSLSTSSMVTKKKTAGNDVTLISSSASLPAMKSNSVEKKNISDSPDPSTPKHLSNCATPPSLSVETKKKTAQRNRVHTPLAALPVTKNTPAEESSKTPNSLGLKLSSLNLGFPKPQNLLSTKLAGNISQKGSLRSSQISSPEFAVSHKHSPSTPSLKRKALVEHNRDTTVLYPSKRISQSPIQSRNFADEAIRILDKKVSNRKNIENDCVKNTIENRQVLNVDDIQHKMNCRGQEISSFVENNSNIKHAEAYNKELDDISNEMRKIYEDAKELLVRATVNSNELLMLNPFLFDQKIHIVQSSFARFTLNGM